MTMLFRGAVDPSDTYWATDDYHIADYYARGCGGKVWTCELTGPVAPVDDYPIEANAMSRNDIRDPNQDSLDRAWDDEYVAIGPMEDFDGDVDRFYRAWAIVDPNIAWTGEER